MTVNVVETFPDFSGVEPLIDADTLLFFSPTLSNTIFKSDGTESGTLSIFPTPDLEDTTEVSFTLTNSAVTNSAGGSGRLLFSANENEFGTELWVSDGTTEGTTILRDINPTGSSNPDNFLHIDSTFFFTAVDEVNGRELWKSDGTPEGTELVANIDTDSVRNAFEHFTNFNGTLFFEARVNNSNDPQLWKSDGTEEGTQLVRDFDFGLQSLTVVGDTLFVQHNNTELWRSDGTTEGTQLVAEQLIPTEFTSVGNTLFFTNDDGVNGTELWKSDGTPEGTQLVRDIRPEVPQNGVPVNGGSNPENLIDVNGTLFFTADDGVNGTELWKSDGTAEGTQLVEDLSVGSDSSILSTFTHVDGILYFTDGSQQLWQSDGTEEGTFRIEPEQISVGGDNFEDSFQNLRELIEFNDELYFYGDAYSLETGDFDTALLTLAEVEDPFGSTVYRFFNPDAGVHFYTANTEERNAVQNLDNYVFEGESYRTVDPLSGGAEEVYRFFNSETGVHLYTTSEDERDNIQANLEEFTFESIAFYAYETQVEGSIPVYRYFEPTIGVHFYTPNEAESTFVEENLDNYNSEGIAYYAFPLAADV